jgi:WD40 repeat protein
MQRSQAGQTVCAWDVASGKEIRSFNLADVSEQDSRTYRMMPRPALSPDGNILAFAGIDHALHFLDLGSGKQVAPQKSNTAALSALGFAADGKHLWAQGCGKSLRQWDWTSGREVDRIPLPIDTSRAAVAANAKYIVTAPWDTKAGRIIRVADGKEIGQIAQPEVRDDLVRDPEHAILSADGALLAMRWERAQRMKLYAIPEGKLLFTLSVPPIPPDMAESFSVCWPSMAFSPDGQLLAAYSRPGVVSFWDTRTGQRRADLPLAGSLPLDAIAFTPDGRSLAVEKSDGSVVLWELASLKERRVFVARTSPPATTKTHLLHATWPALFAAPPVNVAFSPRGDLLFFGAADGAIHIWDVQTGTELSVFRGHTGVINAFAFSAGGKTLASASADTSVLIWDLSALASRPRRRRVFTDAELETRWQVLMGHDAEKAFSAMYDLAAAPAHSVPFLNQRLKPAPALDLERVSRQLADLGDSAFKVREKAAANLLQMDGAVVPFIDKALASAPVLEVQLRLKKIRDQLTSLLLTGEALRLSRAVEVLEHIGTPEARRLLERLAGGAPGSLTTTSARAALDRLTRAVK